MKVEFSKFFIKSARRLSGKMKNSLNDVIEEVRKSNTIEEISNCRKLVDFNNVYRICMGDYRAFFTLHVKIEGDVVFFQYLVSRGEAYDKKNIQKLRLIDD